MTRMLHVPNKSIQFLYWNLDYLNFIEFQSMYWEMPGVPNRWKSIIGRQSVLSIIINRLSSIASINRWKSILTILVLVIAIDFHRLSSIIIDCYRLSSILVSNSWKRIPSILRLVPGNCCIFSVRFWSNM